MELKLLQDNGQLGAGVTASPEVFGRDYNEALVHQIVVAYQANARSGNRKQKDREEVSHTTKKPWRQKGTGRARHHSARAPQFRGGGKAHGPVARSHEHDLPKKVRALGLKHALSAKAKASSIIVVDELKLAEAKTKALVANFATLGLTNALFIGGAELDQGFKRAAANIPNIDVLPIQGINVYDILRRQKLVLTKAALDALEARFK